MEPQKYSIREKTVLVLKGFCMGAADVVPGVSGGTMAFILGIYRQLIDAVRSFDRLWLQSLLTLDFPGIIGRPHLAFLSPLFTGIVCALLFFTRVIPLPQLLLDYPEQVYGLFFGLITGSIVLLLLDLLHHRARAILPVAAGILSGLLVFNMVPLQTPDAAWFIFLSGCLSICAMLLPGISGSFILLILNKYPVVFNAIGYFEFTVLVPFALGAVTGLVLFSRVLSWLLHRYYRDTVLVIVGILIASLWVIWPFQHRVYETIRGENMLVESTPVLPAGFTSAVWLSLALVLAGFIAVVAISRLAAHRERKKQGFGSDQGIE